MWQVSVNIVNTLECSHSLVYIQLTIVKFMFFRQLIQHGDELTFEDALSFLENEVDDRVPLTLQYDMGWQKRSSGRKYDSMSGVGTMLGNESGKVIAYGVRSKDCRTCTVYSNANKEIPAHECYKNFDGSPRSMEADVAGEIVYKCI